MIRRPHWLVKVRVAYFMWRSRRARSPAAWAQHRRDIEAAARYDESRLVERECEAARAWVARLEIAAHVGSTEARHRLKRLRFNPVGTAAAKAASDALARLDKQLMRGNTK